MLVPGWERGVIKVSFLMIKTSTLPFTKTTSSLSGTVRYASSPAFSTHHKTIPHFICSSRLIGDCRTKSGKLATRVEVTFLKHTSINALSQTPLLAFSIKCDILICMFSMKETKQHSNSRHREIPQSSMKKTFSR